MADQFFSMGDLIGFEGYLNESTPFLEEEHKVLWKSDRRYLDFDIGNDYNETCDYPEFWYEDGKRIKPDTLKGCYNSDFDQYGDIEAFGVFPDWQRQLAKFASVQDRLREWKPDVLARLSRFSCMTIGMLDIDGFRIDKAVQVTVDAQAHFSSDMRKCAKEMFGKKNFIVVGEITSGNTLGSIYLGRGREPGPAEELLADPKKAMTLGNATTDVSKYFVREKGNSALDAGAFHYSIYRFMTRFLGMSGNLRAGFDLSTDWIDTWHEMIATNDFWNANTGEFDPRHLYGTSNQDVFRWPAIEKGTERMLLAYFITTFLLPGAPLMYYGEEQELYALDGTAENYVYGRQAMAPSPAWRAHGCFSLRNDLYVDWPVTKGKQGCHDPAVGWDHRNPAAPVRNILKHMFAMRNSSELGVLEHGWLLEKLSNKTDFTLLRGSSDATERGIWSVVRGLFPGVQDNLKDKPVWFVYHNRENTTTYTFNCDKREEALLSPFDAGTKVKNLMDDGEIITLSSSNVKNNYTNSGKNMGCLSEITLEPFEFRVFIDEPEDRWLKPAPMITKFTPGHDVPLDSTKANKKIPIEFYFNTEMDCDSVTNAVTAKLTQTTAEPTTLKFLKPECTKITLKDDEKIKYTGAINSVWKWSATLTDVEDGIIKITVSANATSSDNVITGTRDHFLIRFGKPQNPVVWGTDATYSWDLLQGVTGNRYKIKHAAAGATKWRYSTNFGSTWSDWNDYTGTDISVTEQPWSGTALQAWEGNHIQVQYFSKPLGSSAFIQHSDRGTNFQRVFPHVKLHGPFNKWGYDTGLPGSMDLVGHNTWSLHYMYEWPANFQLNVWGINPDNQPDVSYIFGDIDGDHVVDRLPPSSLANNVINITDPPPMPALAWKVYYNDATWTYRLEAAGNMNVQIALFWLFAILPVALACLAGWIYVTSFYQVKVNKSGFAAKGWMPLKIGNLSKLNIATGGKGVEMNAITPPPPSSALAPIGAAGGRRTVLIATMEYNIDDFKIKIKIGGLGVMAQLMANALNHMDIVWVIPVVGDVDYPLEKMQKAEPMYVDVMGQPYEIEVYYYNVKNITYVLLDAPIFRKQTKADPYIARMDDIESAILYAAWNSCIAESIRRFPVDIYHINDYHGAAAPLYLLPQTIPVCLSLHNAEFQGMWPMRTPEEAKEVCEVFNLPPDVVKDYVQYGSVFNLLHAGASYLRIHQRGFGAVGVSRKYGDRSLARYPIFWSLKNIGQLPNPDPSDTADWDPSQDQNDQAKGVEVDQSFEEKRAEYRKQAQEWAGLEVDPTAELFVFVGRWSLQKGVDLIADLFPSILEKVSYSRHNNAMNVIWLLTESIIVPQDSAHLRWSRH